MFYNFWRVNRNNFKSWNVAVKYSGIDMSLAGKTTSFTSYARHILEHIKVGKVITKVPKYHILKKMPFDVEVFVKFYVAQFRACLLGEISKMYRMSIGTVLVLSKLSIGM